MCLETTCTACSNEKWNSGVTMLDSFYGSLRFLTSVYEVLVNRTMLYFLQHLGIGFEPQDKAKRLHLRKCRSKKQRKV